MKQIPKVETLPGWFTGEIEELRKFFQDENIDKTEMLTQSRKEFYDNLSVFYSQARYLISLYPAIFTVVLGLVGFTVKHEPSQGTFVKLFAGILLISAGLIRSFAYRLVKTQYGLYVASLIFATQIHVAAGLGTHRWFQWILEYLQNPKENVKTISWYLRIFGKQDLSGSPKSKAELTERWMWSTDSTAYSYITLMIWFSMTSVISGIALICWSLMEYY